MLGTIAKKLRVLGFDCSYLPSLDDQQVIQSAKSEERRVITKDRLLAARCKKCGVAAICIMSNDEKEQLIQIAAECGLAEYELDASSTRCVSCNGVLDETPKSLIISKIPPKVASRIERFWQCRSCSHVYWEGTHIRNIREIISEINAGIQRNR